MVASFHSLEYGHFAEHNCFWLARARGRMILLGALELLVYFISFLQSAFYFDSNFLFFDCAAASLSFAIYIINFLFALLSFQSHPICLASYLKRAFLSRAVEDENREKNRKLSSMVRRASFFEQRRTVC